jgi:hypothetical protein
MSIKDEWALEFKLARPYGNNGILAENWTVNLTHPYPGNTSALGDALKLRELRGFKKKAVAVIGYEHENVTTDLEPLIRSFEVIAECVLAIRLGTRHSQVRTGLVHPVHSVLKLYAWEVL